MTKYTWAQWACLRVRAPAHMPRGGGAIAFSRNVSWRTTQPSSRDLQIIRIFSTSLFLPRDLRDDDEERRTARPCRPVDRRSIGQSGQGEREGGLSRAPIAIAASGNKRLTSAKGREFRQEVSSKTQAASYGWVILVLRELMEEAQEAAEPLMLTRYLAEIELRR